MKSAGTSCRPELGHRCSPSVFQPPVSNNPPSIPIAKSGAHARRPADLKGLEAKLRAGQCAAPGTASLSAACKQLSFDLATCLVFHNVDPESGLLTYRALAERGDVDAMVGVGVVLIEGIGIEEPELDAAAAEGVQWLRKAADQGHPQAHYEIGTLYYLGRVPGESSGAATADTDALEAYRHFNLAAAKNHTSGCFMTAELLMEGTGCAADAPRAVRLLHVAAERGHRMARHYIREWLDEDAKKNPDAVASLQPPPVVTESQCNGEPAR